jgi:hypothetical protein
MNRLIYISLFLLIFLSCTVRTYDVNFHYYVGNNEDLEKLQEQDINSEETNNLQRQVIFIPPGSGNLTIYIQAEVPKHIQADADAQLSTPLLGR